MSLAHPCTPFERIAARYIRYRRSMGYHFVSQASYIGSCVDFSRRGVLVISIRRGLRLGRARSSTCTAARAAPPSRSFITSADIGDALSPAALCRTPCTLPSVVPIARR